MSLTGKPIAPLKPGSPEWLQTISASKIPAILGISPWQSRFALWHLMAGNTEPWDGNKSTERGTFLEAAVLSWFEAQHEDIGRLYSDTSLGWVEGKSIAHSNYPEWTAAPDAIFVKDKFRTHLGVEVKTSQYSDEWGTPGTAEIPPYYLAQVAWQMIVCGFETVYVPVLFGQPFEFREYVVNYADVASDIPAIVQTVKEFQTSLRKGEQPPIDGSSSTYQAIKELHPDIDGETVELDGELVTNFLYAKAVAESATQKADLYKNQIADFMGTAKKAEWNKKTIFTRQSKNGGTPYLVIGRSLPDISKEEKAA
jgi:putative phage-type endonuclease